jgi:hypothetical protein
MVDSEHISLAPKHTIMVKARWCERFNVAPHSLQSSEVVYNNGDMHRGQLLIRSLLDGKCSNNIGESHSRCWCLRCRSNVHKLSTWRIWAADGTWRSVTVSVYFSSSRTCFWDDVPSPFWSSSMVGGGKTKVNFDRKIELLSSIWQDTVRSLSEILRVAAAELELSGAPYQMVSS